MSIAPASWLTVVRNDSPLLVSLPHTGVIVPSDIETRLTSSWLSRKDTDWWLERLYDFAAEFGATVVRTTISRTVIDVNRDPSGISLYPGQASTELCPSTTFDGEPLYRKDAEPDANESDHRRIAYFEPYHNALATELTRLRTQHANVVLYDCHSIRSVIPRLFDGTLPEFNIGTNSGASCAPRLTAAVEAICDRSGRSWVSNGRFKGGYITRKFGRLQQGVHALQMEIACRAYLREPIGRVDQVDWPAPYDPDYAEPLRVLLKTIFEACLSFCDERTSLRT